MPEMKTNFFLLFSILYLAFDALGQNQCLDASFGNAGIVQVNFGNDSIFPKSIALQQDGKIVVGADIISAQNRDFIVSRFNADGSVDNTFGINGIIVSDFINSKDYLKKILIQNDGKILIGGNSMVAGFQKYSFIRLNTDGSLDFTFGLNGKISHEIDVNSHHFLQDMVINNLGNIVFVGQSSNGEYDYFYHYIDPQQMNYVVQLNSDGSLDYTFNNIGYTLIPSSGIYFSANKIALLQNQDIIISGFKHSNLGQEMVFVSKISNNGILDLSFGINGFTEIYFDSLIRPKQLSVDINDKIFIQANSGDNGVWAFIGVELNNVGVIEDIIGFNYIFYFTDIYKNFNTFKSNGFYINLTDSYNYHDTIWSGDFKLYTINSQNNLATNMCGQGEIFVDVAPGAEDQAVDALMQVDNKFVQLGAAGTNKFTLIRYLNTVFAGNNEIADKINIPKIFPNPAAHSLNIKGGIGQIQIVDVLGNNIQTFCVTHNDFNIDVSDYPQGLYFINLISANKEVFNFKFIKE